MKISIKILITAREASDKYNWEKFCDITGLSYWCLNEGMDDNLEFELTEEQAKQIGIIRENEKN